MTEHHTESRVRIEDLDIEQDERSSVVADDADLHLTDARSLQRMRTSGTTTSPGASDEDN